MSTTRPLARFETTLDLTVDDEHTYTVKSPSIKVGAFIIEASNVIESLAACEEKGEEAPPELLEAVKRVQKGDAFGDESEDQYRAILGPVYDEMVDDGQPFEVLRMAMSTVMIWVKASREEAIKFWDEGGRPNPTNRATRRRKTSGSRQT